MFSDMERYGWLDWANGSCRYVGANRMAIELQNAIKNGKLLQYVLLIME